MVNSCFLYFPYQSCLAEVSINVMLVKLRFSTKSGRWPGPAKFNPLSLCHFFREQIKKNKIFCWNFENMINCSLLNSLFLLRVGLKRIYKMPGFEPGTFWFRSKIFRMEAAVDSIVRGIDLPSDLSPEILTSLDPKSGKTLLEIAVITGRPNSINQIMKLKPDLLSYVGFCGLNLVHLVRARN